MGFSRLINFQRPLATTHYMDFLAYQLPDYVLEVAFAFGLILAGLHLAEWARRIFGIQQYHSSVVLCHTLRSISTEDASGMERPSSREKGQGLGWSVVQGVDKGFLAWAREPNKDASFEVTICWAEVLTEAADRQGPRFVIDMFRSDSLDEAMERVIELPFCADFRADTTDHITVTQDLPADNT